MADNEHSKASGPPESPTTARELDFDDEPHETSASPPPRTLTPKKESATKVPTPGLDEDVAPPKPPRPVNPMQQAENTLREAFPNIDAAVVKAVLRASGGSVEPAFNALLGMSDPDAQAEPTPPPQPPRRAQSPVVQTSTARSQLAADEQYARQLAEHYNGAAAYNAPRTASRAQRSAVSPSQRQSSRQDELYDNERERSFIDDDLPVIRDNIKKGFLETQSKVNSWVTNLRKKIDGENDDDLQGGPAPATGYRQPQNGNRRSSDYQRRSQDQERYDADPQVLGDDFTGLQLRDTESTQRRSSRPLANPDLFKPTPPRPQVQGGRRVSFQDGPPETIGVQSHPTPDINARSPPPGGKASKWQPLAAVDPSPVADHDPFSLGDSDDDETKKKDLKADDTERLKQAAAEAMSEDISSPGNKKLEPHERTGSFGTRDRETEKLVNNS